MKSLKRNDIEIRLSVMPDDIPVRGNACHTDDEREDKALEDEILARLDNGDVWAWACVCVSAHLEGFVGKAYLGCCSYQDEKSFIDGSYYQDMVEEAIADLKDQVANSIQRAGKALTVLI